MANYFSDVRAQVDIELAKKQQIYQREKQVNELWLKLIARIYAFKKECLKTKKVKTEETSAKILDDIQSKLDELELSNQTQAEIRETIRRE